MTERANRRLAAILAADVAGYTRLVQQDEEGTVRAWQACRSSLIDPCIDRFGGRIANTAGDSILAEFPSAVEAARCAVAIQSALDDRNLAGASPPIALRIGLTVGDVISDGGDLLGDGVNIAARLEQMAEPGAAMASATFADQVRGRADIGFLPLGAKRLKNVADPVEVFALAPGAHRPAARRKMRSVAAGLAAVALVLAALGGLFWWHPWRLDMTPAQERLMAYPLPDKPSVAVLPFKTLSEKSVFLADGLTDDLITDLSKVSGLFVIAGNTSFALRDADMDVAGFSEAVGVRYVIDGGIRRTGDDLRVNARLVDATSGQLIWADRYEGAVSNVFSIQTQLAVEVTQALGVAVPDGEMSQIKRMDTQMVDAREAFQRGWALYSRFNERDNDAAIPFFEQAVQLDPDYGRAYAALALAHLRPHLFHHWNNHLAEGDGLHITRFFKYQKLASRYDTSLVHVIAAMVQLNLKDLATQSGETTRIESARLEAARAIALSPSDPEAHITMAWALIAGGEPAEGLTFVKAAMRLDPKYPIHYTLFEAAAHFAAGNVQGAVDALQAGLERDSQAVELLPPLASFLAQLGQRREARAVVERWLPDRSQAEIDAAVEEYFFIVRWASAQRHLNQRLKDGLRLAALSRDTTVPKLRADLAGADAIRQRDAARALALFGPAAAPAVPELIAALQSGSGVVRKEAVIALGRIGPAAAAAVPALQELQGGSLVGGHAHRALKLIRGE